MCPSVRPTSPCGHDTDNRGFCPITFKLHIYVVYDERRNPVDFCVIGSKVNFGTLYIKPIGHDTEYSLFGLGQFALF